MGAYANGCPGAPIKAWDEAKTSGLGKDSNTEWRPRTPVPFGLLPKTPIAALQSLAGRPARLRLCAFRSAVSAPHRVCVHSVNGPRETPRDRLPGRCGRMAADCDVVMRQAGCR